MCDVCCRTYRTTHSNRVHPSHPSLPPPPLTQAAAATFHTALGRSVHSFFFDPKQRGLGVAPADLFLPRWVAAGVVGAGLVAAGGLWLTVPGACSGGLLQQ
jgi:hypothetical protein